MPYFLPPAVSVHVEPSKKASSTAAPSGRARGGVRDASNRRTSSLGGWLRSLFPSHRPERGGTLRARSFWDHDESSDFKDRRARRAVTVGDHLDRSSHRLGSDRILGWNAPRDLSEGHPTVVTAAQQRRHLPVIEPTTSPDFDPNRFPGPDRRDEHQFLVDDAHAASQAGPLQTWSPDSTSFGSGRRLLEADRLREEKLEARRQRRNLKESGDYLGVQGLNPETGQPDIITPTDSEGSIRSQKSQQRNNTGGRRTYDSHHLFRGNRSQRGKFVEYIRPAVQGYSPRRPQHDKSANKVAAPGFWRRRQTNRPSSAQEPGFSYHTSLQEIKKTPFRRSSKQVDASYPGQAATGGLAELGGPQEPLVACSSPDLGSRHRNEYDQRTGSTATVVRARRRENAAGPTPSAWELFAAGIDFDRGSEFSPNKPTVERMTSSSSRPAEYCCGPQIICSEDVAWTSTGRDTSEAGLQAPQLQSAFKSSPKTYERKIPQVLSPDFSLSGQGSPSALQASQSKGFKAPSMRDGERTPSRLRRSLSLVRRRAGPVSSVQVQKWDQTSYAPVEQGCKLGRDPICAAKDINHVRYPDGEAFAPSERSRLRWLRPQRGSLNLKRGDGAKAHLFPKGNRANETTLPTSNAAAGLEDVARPSVREEARSYTDSYNGMVGSRRATMDGGRSSSKTTKFTLSGLVHAGLIDYQQRRDKETRDSRCVANLMPGASYAGNMETGAPIHSASPALGRGICRDIRKSPGSRSPSGGFIDNLPPASNLGHGLETERPSRLSPIYPTSTMADQAAIFEMPATREAKMPGLPPRVNPTLALDPRLSPASRPILETGGATYPLTGATVKSNAAEDGARPSAEAIPVDQVSAQGAPMKEKGRPNREPPPDAQMGKPTISGRRRLHKDSFSAKLMTVPGAFPLSSDDGFDETGLDAELVKGEGRELRPGPAQLRSIDSDMETDEGEGDGWTAAKEIAWAARSQMAATARLYWETIKPVLDARSEYWERNARNEATLADGMALVLAAPAAFAGTVVVV